MGSLAVAVSRSAPAADAVDSMLRAAPHRGAALAIHAERGSALGVSWNPEAPDAWVATQNGTAAAFVGSLENAAELTRRLADERVSPDDAKDPAHILLAAYRAWGDAAFQQLRGAFTAAVLADSTVRCVRDQLGLRPLFYRDESGRFLAATEAKQVVAGAGIQREPDVQAVEDLFYGRLTSRTAALRGVSRFPRATAVTVHGDARAVFGRYWDPRRLLERARFSPEETRERLEELLEAVVARSVTGNDVVSLSGGIDSPTIAALAAERHRELSGTPLRALTSVYPDHPSVDERRYTELVAAHLGLPLETYVPSARPLDDVQRWVDLVDGPVETLSLPELAENYDRVRALGARTVLTGEMAEWVFTFQSHLIGHLVLHGRVRAAAAWLREQRSYGGSWREIARVAAPSLTPPRAAAWYLRRRGRQNGYAPAWIVSAQQGGGFRADLARPARKRWLEHQLDPLLTPPTTSLDADEICAAACGVQVKRPLADIDLWEFVLSLPAERKFPSSLSKVLIRDVMRGRLPDEILDRRDKTAFTQWVFATADWGGLRRWLADPNPPLAGVDYKVLMEAIERRQMNVLELMWAYDLARAHAFLDLWR